MPGAAGPGPGADGAGGGRRTAGARRGARLPAGAGAGMAGRTVRVRGLPTDLPPDRVADKLTIHFLRSRNGGGDIAELRVLPGPPPCAIIAFEAPEGNGRRAPALPAPQTRVPPVSRVGRAGTGLRPLGSGPG